MFTCQKPRQDGCDAAFRSRAHAQQYYVGAREFGLDEHQAMSCCSAAVYRCNGRRGSLPLLAGCFRLHILSIALYSATTVVITRS